MDALERFISHISPEPNSGCYLWDSVVNEDGYARFWFNGKLVRAHKWIWQFHYGEVPVGLELDHKCRVRSCVNPFHLRAVSHKENMAMVTRFDGKCKNGHEFTPENTYNHPDGSRKCLICKNAYNKEWIKNKRKMSRDSSLRAEDPIP